MSALAAPDLELAEPAAGPGDPCIQCGGVRRFPARRHRAEAMADPFCSSECCRLWYGLGSEDHSHLRPKFRKRSYV